MDTKNLKIKGKGLMELLKRPVLGSVIIMFFAISVTFIPLTPVIERVVYSQQEAEYWTGIIEQGVVSIGLGYLLKKMGLFSKVGFNCIGRKLWVVWPLLLFCIFIIGDYLGGNQQIDWQKPRVILLFGLCYMSTGVFEEILCRGVVYQLMFEKWGDSKRGCYEALILSSLLFGATHLVHYFLGHSNLIASLAQVGYATCFGVFFCGCFVRTKSIYPAIILHGILDIVCDLEEISVGGGINKSYQVMSISQGITLVLLTLPFFIYGIWCVRKEFAKTV